jgi:hypothetical protein
MENDLHIAFRIYNDDGFKLDDTGMKYFGMNENFDMDISLYSFLID